MSEKKTQLNILLDKELYEMEKASKKDDESMSNVAKELMEDSLENHEDLILLEMAVEYENKKQVPDDKAWK